MPLPVDHLLAAAMLREHLLDYPGAALYAVIDMARGEPAREVVRLAGTDHRCLLSGELPPALARVMPVVARIGAGDDTLARVLAALWGQHLGVILSSPLELDPLREHLGQQLLVKQGGGRALFRFYDPRVARKELSGGAPGRLEALLSRVGFLVVEGDEGALVHQVRAGGQLIRWDLRWDLSEARALAAGEDLEEPEARAAAAQGAVEQALARLRQDRAAREAAHLREERALEERRAALIEAGAFQVDLADRADSLGKEAAAAEAELARARSQEQELSGGMQALAGAMGQNTLEVMTRFNRLRAEGARLGKDPEANAEALARVEAELSQLRAQIEAQKQGAGQHGELEQRRAEAAEQVARLERSAQRLGVESAAARAEAQSQEARRGALIQEVEALERKPGPEGDSDQDAALERGAEEVERLADEASRVREPVAQAEDAVRRALGPYSRAVAGHNVQQKMALKGAEERARTAAAAERLRAAAAEVASLVRDHQRAVAACVAQYERLCHAATTWLERSGAKQEGP